MNIADKKPRTNYNNRFSDQMKEKIIREIIKKKIRGADELNDLKREIAKKFRTDCPSNPSLFNAYRKMLKKKTAAKNKKIEELLKINKMRTLSGVAVVAVLTKPMGCPGNCVYCPTEKNLPKSYLAGEPAVMRAVLNEFDPFRQVKTRLGSLEATGHETDKVELIIIGGTFSALGRNYRTWFVKRCFEACNAKTKIDSNDLQKIKKKNEKARHRIIGITVETRQDYVNEEEIKFLRYLGVTRVELGVQSIYDEILALCRRGHTVKETVQATKLLKDAGFKVSYHLMPNLPGATPRKDLKMFKELFANPDFQPDLLKIYPTVVTKNSELYGWWKDKKYQPYSDRTLIKLLLDIKKQVPPYVRISRLVRDIPAPDIISGSKISNLRQILEAESRKQGWHCRCIRCREVKNRKTASGDFKLKRLDYPASGGQEIFLTFEDEKNDKLLALLRLRIPSWFYDSSVSRTADSKTVPTGALAQTAIIREVHTYGRLVPIARKIKGASQHSGLGRRLIKEAERIVRQEFGLKKIAVISGVGVRDYYRHSGYNLEDEYMVKEL